MRKKKKILMVHNFYQIGGGEHTVFKNEVELLRDNGHEVIEYTRSNDELKSDKWKLLFLPFTTVWSLRTYIEIRKLIKNEQIDVVHCHNTFPLISPSVYYAARSMKVPVVQTIHNFRLLCPNGSFYCKGKVCEKCRENGNFKEAIKNKCYRNSTLGTIIVAAMLTVNRKLGIYKKISYIFLTEFNKSKFDKLIDINSNQVFVKPNFVSRKGEPSKGAHKRVFIFASRLEENKGIKLLLELWKLLPKDYYLHIYGDGTLKNFVEENVKENISFYGFTPQKTIFEDLSTATALVFPSIWYEGFPMILAEAMAIGCPVVSTNIGNAGDILVNSKGGTTFEPDKPDTFINAIEDVLQNNEIYQKNALAYYSETLSKDKNYVLQNDIYEHLFGGGVRTYIYAGRLDKGKGILKLLNEWITLPGTYVLEVYGEGECAAEVRKLAAKCPNIHLNGFCPQKELFNSLKSAVALITPYIWYEGYPMNIAECFSLGVPVVSTSIGNAGDLVSKSNAGTLFDFEVKGSFRKALDAVYEQRTKFSFNAYNYYLCNQTPASNYERLNKIYDTL